MVTLALLTIAPYSQKLDHRDLHQTTFGGKTIYLYMGAAFFMKQQYHCFANVRNYEQYKTYLFNYCVHHHQIILSIVVSVMFNLLIIRCLGLLSSCVLASLETTSPCKTLLLLTATMPSNKNAAAASEIAAANKDLMAMISRKRAQNLNQGF